MVHSSIPEKFSCGLKEPALDFANDGIEYSEVVTFGLILLATASSLHNLSVSRACLMGGSLLLLHIGEIPNPDIAGDAGIAGTDIGVGDDTTTGAAC